MHGGHRIFEVRGVCVLPGHLLNVIINKQKISIDPYGLNGGPFTGDPWGIQKHLADQADAQRIADGLKKIMVSNPPDALNAVSVVAPVAHNIPWIPIAGVAGVLFMLMIMSR